jgi:hypothetical protein
MLQIIIDYGKLGVPVVTTLLPILRTSTTFAKEISSSDPPPMSYILSHSRGCQSVSCCRYGRTRSPCRTVPIAE